MTSRLSLRTLLTLPFLGLVIALAVVIAVLSYRAGRDAVDTWSEQLLLETVGRIAQAVDRHVAGSEAVLEVAFPDGVAAPASIEADLDALRTRFWLATSVHLDPNNYAYYGDRRGHFFGLWRFSATQAEMRLRTDGQSPRRLYRFEGIRGALGPAVSESRIFDPRSRPWFKAGESKAVQTWTSIYIDFKTSELVATRARRVNNPQGEVEGVVATDLSLERVNTFLESLALSRNGVAMVVEADGQVIGVSRGPHLRTGADGTNQRLNAADSPDALVASAYAAVQGEIGRTGDDQARTGVFDGPDGGLVQVAYTRLRDTAGLDWLILVAVPRHDFMSGVVENFKLTVVLAALASLLTLAIGLWILHTVTRELARLTQAARRIGEGDWRTPLVSTRTDELGDLARTFAEMQSRLLTDQLTGLSNRDAVMRQIEDRVQRHRRRSDTQPFGVMFADLNQFKQINDRFGHAVGDEVLQEVARRLRGAVRAQDTVARYAGDEFIIVIDAVDHRRDAEVVRDQLAAALREPMKALGPGEPPLGAAIGVAIYPEDGQDVETLIRHADTDMYRRKGGD